MNTLCVGDPITTQIDALGFSGDGVARYGEFKIMIPYSCVGETISATITHTNKHFATAQLNEVITPSPERAIPLCKHYGICGGCKLQHLSPNAIHNFKHGKLTQVLARLGLNDEESSRITRPLISAGMASRRRVDMACSISKSGEVSLGFHGLGSTYIAPIDECPITIPAITTLFEPLRNLITHMTRGKHLCAIRIQEVQTDSLDIALQVRKDLPESDRDLWRSFAIQQHISRISEQCIDTYGKIQTTQNLINHEPCSLLAGYPVKMPVGAFMQAAKAGQDALTDFVLAHTQDADTIIDFYCGIGTYSIPLCARGGTIHAYEGSEDMTQALINVSRRAHLDTRLHVHTRDLFKNIVKAEEIIHADAVIINPPRNGAEPQTKAIAASGVKKVIMVSCNPVTCERDAQSLIRAGYQITAALAVDQFVMSEHVEIALVFEKRIP